MLRFSLILTFLISGLNICAQQSREALERQRAQLRKEIAATEELLKKNKSLSKENFLQWKLVNNKVELQDRVVSNLNKDIKVLTDNMYILQKDINRYNRLLDTLRREYATSMIYAYKNRSNYDFLNFIFSSDNFNDAIKRVAYLKSYRSYREMQGDNIVRTQMMRQQRIDELKGTRNIKNQTFKSQAEELKLLELQKQEKDRIALELKKQGSKLNNDIAAKRQQMAKVNVAVNAAIKKAQDEARKLAMAKKAEEERIRRDEAKALAAKLAEEERIRKEEEERMSRVVAARGDASKATTGNVTANRPGIASAPNVTVPKTSIEPSATASATPVSKPATVAAKPATRPAAKPANELLPSSESVALNASFEVNRGKLPWPLDKGYLLMKFGSNKLPSGSDLVITSITISSDVGSSVKAVFDGTVVMAQTIEDMQVVTIQHGLYYTSYSNLTGVVVKKDQVVKTGQVIGKVAPNMDGVGAIDFYVSKGTAEQDPARWLSPR